MLSNCRSLAAGALVSKNLISTSNKLFRSASNTFKEADFVYLREQEILPLYKFSTRYPHYCLPLKTANKKGKLFLLVHFSPII